MVSLKELNIKLTKDDIAKSTTPDKILVQVLHSLDELDIVIRRMSVSLKEWYSYYAPSVLKIAEPELLIKIVDKKEIEEMGAKFSKADLDACINYSLQIKSLLELRIKHFTYLEKMMNSISPNLLEVAGVYVGAKLIALAGSLKILAEMRSSTVQVLGAEKALFRHLKKKSKPPKFGVIYMHPSISNAKEKAKIARKLASEIVIATRRDYFKNG